jgi:hypothetical protein
MRITIFLLFASVSAMANWMVDTDTVLSNAQTAGIRSYPSLKKCQVERPGLTCINFTGHNLRFERYVAGAWVTNAPSQTTYNTEVSNRAAAAVARTTRRAKIKTGPADAAASNSIPALRAVVQTLAEELKELTGE